ncbi:DUF418 domain-containing protein [Saccharibacillus sp. JS10]|uniref:DUF418 domain-containing protein n=1 Tax=Saccharibacillus sp. JS10 TaxID=2950552 RepID=UPI002109BEBC|nr:DUF418 domain-containing protein [Saccharibacillus sp. JS10]MCQ4086577.1 DUF418 domain-containing protein [Saccharibacillus sp. JS10]
MQTQKQKRIELLDILRGFAILGTLGTNIWLFATYSDLSTFLDLSNWNASAEGIVTALQSIFVNGKMLGLLTILFGVGLEMRYRKAKRTGLPWRRFILWTMLLLLLDGLLHYVFVFEYDVLMSYAVTGMIVAMLIGLSERKLTVIMIVCLSLHVLLMLPLSLGLGWIMQDAGFRRELLALGQETQTLYANGSYIEQILYRLNNFFSLRVEGVVIGLMNIGLYIAGIKLLRGEAFQNTDKGCRTRGKLLKFVLPIALVLNIIPLLASGYLDLALRYIFAPLLSVGYIGLLGWIADKDALRGMTNRFADIGKAALSCYVLQNILASVFFYGWGFGLGEYYSVWLTLGMFALIAVLIATAAYLFVRRWQAGPLELLWRKLSYAPFRNSRSS